MGKKNDLQKQVNRYFSKEQGNVVEKHLILQNPDLSVSAIFSSIQTAASKTKSPLT